ncbi:MAG: hypothetical protein EBR32_06735 [Bacteroidetes bacterium]|nr:hypothetical protein [Bacteroidota bacterium]
MRTSIDLDDDLLLQAKIHAVNNNTSLKDIITISLQKELGIKTSESQESILEVVNKLVEYDIIKNEDRNRAAELIIKSLFIC